jgi:tight adherence protein B
VRVVEAKGPNFPVRTFVITLPQGSKLSIRDITITENGTPVIEPSLTPASKASRKTFGVVLVLDTSWSMRGKPLAAAIAAENAFVAQRNPNEQVGAINFNRETTPVLPLTASAEKITAGLATKPQIATGTHIYDAVGEAEAMLRKAHINSGSIVVLSDGADTGSTKTIYQVTKAARQSHMHIYTIGLVDKTYKPSTLKGLAKEGGGQYAEAQAQALSPLYGRLSQVLSNEYLLQYKSLAGPDAKVKVSVTVNGVGSSDTQYQTPAIPVHSAVSAPYKQSLGSRVWGSVITMILLALLAAGAVALLAIVLFQPQKSNLPTRMAEFVSIRDLQRDKGGATAAAAAAAAAAGPDGQHKSRWQRFEEMLEIADIKASPETIVAGTFAATGLTFLLIYTGTGSLGWALLAFAVPYIVREWVLRTLKRRRDKFAEQLPDALQVVASALRSGHSFAGALAVVVESGSEPMKSELQRVVADEQLGVPIQDSLGVVAERMASRDVEQLALVAELQRESGGNAAEVIDRVAETVRERFDLKRLIRTLTTQGRMSRWIVSALPVFIIIFLRIINPGYLHPLLATTGGRVVFGLAAAWAILGSLLIKRIVEIEV